jgi:hypothetical protein
LITSQAQKLFSSPRFTLAPTSTHLNKKVTVLGNKLSTALAGTVAAVVLDTTTGSSSLVLGEAVLGDIARKQLVKVRHGLGEDLLRGVVDRERDLGVQGRYVAAVLGEVLGGRRKAGGKEERPVSGARSG